MSVLSLGQPGPRIRHTDTHCEKHAIDRRIRESVEWDIPTRQGVCSHLVLPVRSRMRRQTNSAAGYVFFRTGRSLYQRMHDAVEFAQPQWAREWRRARRHRAILPGAVIVYCCFGYCYSTIIFAAIGIVSFCLQLLERFQDSLA